MSIIYWKQWKKTKIERNWRLKIYLPKSTKQISWLTSTWNFFNENLSDETNEKENLNGKEVNEKLYEKELQKSKANRVYSWIGNNEKRW